MARTKAASAAKEDVESGPITVSVSRRPETAGKGGARGASATVKEAAAVVGSRCCTAVQAGAAVDSRKGHGHESHSLEQLSGADTGRPGQHDTDCESTTG